MRIISLCTGVCLTCGKQWTGKTSREVGERHAKLHKHNVKVDINMEYTYFEEEKENGKG